MCHLDHHRKFPTKIIGCAIWILILLEAAKTPNESNQNPKPKTQLSSMVRPVCGGKEEIEERTTFDRDTLGQEKHDDVIDPTSTGRSVCGRIHKATRIGGSKRGARNCFQSTRTVTCSCEKKNRTSPRSRAPQKDRKSSSSRGTSCRSAAE